MDTTLMPLLSQPAGVPWPTHGWPTGPLPDHVAPLIDAMFEDEATYGDTYAVVVVQGGRLRAERYGGALPHFDREPEAVTPDTSLLSWSMAKSILHAALGPLVATGRLVLDAPARVPEWAEPGDPRGAITLDQLLCMRDGLDFCEDYVDAGVSDVIEMLFGAGSSDVAHFAADRKLAYEPGSTFNYSSGTSNIVAGIVAREVGVHEEYDRFLRQTIFDPIGMTSAQPHFDAAGTFIGSSYVYATARDFARFGLLALRGGVWDGAQVLPPGWIDHGRLPRSRDPKDGRLHGAHWWVVGDDVGSFRCSGYEGQSILMTPALDLVVVRLGKTPETKDDALTAWRAVMVDAFRERLT